jgi:hypothetical protein
MHHQRTYFMPYEQRRRVEAAILALVLAEDWPWRAGELAHRLRLPVDVIGLGTATLHADGLLVPVPASRGRDGERLRASWAAVRGDELAGWGDSNKRRVYVPRSGAAIPIY